MTDRELMQQALEALEANQPVNYCMNNNGEKFPMMQGDPFRFDRNTKAITALNERLAQPDAYGYASRLAVAMWEQHYKDVAPQWKPLDDLMGVLTQIDNMTSGLTRLAQSEQEPVACVQDLGEVKRKHLVYEKGMDWKDPLYTTPPQRKPLTEEEIWELAAHCLDSVAGRMQFARAIEAKLKAKNS